MCHFYKQYAYWSLFRTAVVKQCQIYFIFSVNISFWYTFKYCNIRYLCSSQFVFLNRFQNTHVNFFWELFGSFCQKHWKSYVDITRDIFTMHIDADLSSLTTHVHYPKNSQTITHIHAHAPYTKPNAYTKTNSPSCILHTF